MMKKIMKVKKRRWIQWRLRWMVWIILVIIFLTGIIRTYKYVNNDYSVDDSIFDYPLNVNLYEIYEKFYPSHTLVPNANVSVRPINPANFPLILSPKSLCQPVRSNTRHNNHLDVLFLVKTRPTSFDQRTTIRKTWGNPNCTLALKAHTRTVFLLGLLPKPEPTTESLLQLEHTDHNDILQFGFVDDYFNNTYKVMTALEHISKKCTHTRFVVLVDDDFLVHVKNLLRTIGQVTKLQYQTYVSGLVFSKPLPSRKPWEKWYVSYHTYPYAFYPPFVSGGTVILSMPVVRLLAVGMPFVKFYWIDDVFLGIVLHKYGISPKLLRDVYVPEIPKDIDLGTLVSGHGFGEPLKLEHAWKGLMKIGVCGS